MNEKTKNFCLKLGEFSASPENGSACYSLPLKLPKGSNDFSPALSLNYCSLPNDTSDGLLGSGWQLQGTPRGRFDGENGLLQNGKKALLTIEKAIISHLSSSGVTTYFEFEDKKEKERLRATKRVDLFGNQILFRYGKEGELSRIDYGCKKTLNRSVQFRYLKEGPWLSSIQTLIAGEEYFSYFLERNGKELQQISSYCPGEKGEPENYGAVAFSYNEDTKGQLLLQTVKDAAGLTVKTNYCEPSGILDQYDLVASRPRGKKVTYTHKIDVNGKPVKAGGRLVYPLVVLQNEGALRGEFFEYETEGDDAGALIKEGEFAISGSDSVQKEYCFTGKEENGKAPYQYPLITEKQYSYTRHPLTDALLLERVSARQFIQPGKALPARKSSYVYSDTGLLTTISDGEKEECFDYLDHPFNSTISHLRSRSIRDLKTWEVLSDTQFSYQFSQKDRQISSISRRSMIEDGLYSNEEVISLGDAGLITEKVNPAGLITQYNYDSFQNPVSETAISKDKKKTLSAHSECHPASGDVLKARSFEGSICQFRYDGFGRRIQIKGFDPSNAASWKKDTGIVPLCSTAYVYDQSLKTRVEISRRPGKQRGQVLEKRVLFDGMQRPTAEVTELEAGSWLVVSIRYDTAGRECARSIPHRLKTGKNSLAEKLAALDAQDLKWVETEYDAFGREKTITYPDGSRLLLDYRLSGENSVLVQERSVSSDGKNSTVRQQLFSSRGLLLTSALGAQVKDRFDYDGLGRKVRKTDINGNETHYKWNALDFCVSESNSISGILSLKMDQKLQISSEEKNGDCLEHQYDWLGRRTATTSKDGKTYHTLYEEDLLNRSTSVTHIHPEGWSSTHRFSPTGQEIEKAVTLGEENTLLVKSLLNPDGSI
ncbi:MAG: hypothetical protein MI743_15935, partial [Sneathiellales bacterium]|nr:hypothetical protein [Sneathiellales bacterium]